MQALEYLVIASAVIFTVTFGLLLNVSGLFDCFKNSTIKSAFHCLNLIAIQCNHALAKSAKKDIGGKRKGLNHIQTACAIHWGLIVQLGNKQII